ncbi:unnamed protein product, partial [marine sediment metagenome]
MHETQKGQYPDVSQNWRKSPEWQKVRNYKTSNKKSIKEVKKTPELGEIKRGREIGKNYNGRFIWFACRVCGNPRWVTFVNGKAKSERCLTCANHT